MKTPRRLSILLALILGTSCGASYRGFSSYQATQRFALGEASSDPAIAELAERFYAPSMDPAAMRTEVDALLASAPHDATLNEMAAHLAELREDDRAAWAHWMQAAADTNTPLGAIYLDRALTYDLTASQTNATIALLRRMASEHPEPELRVDATVRLIRFLETYEGFEEADRLSAGLDFIRDWQLIGAFDNDQGRGFHAVHPPEEAIDFEAEPRGVLLPVRWRPVESIDRTGLVRLSEMASPDRWVVGYLVTHVHSEEARDVTLRVSTPTGTKVWLNGQLVLSQERLARGATDNVVLPVRLEAGWNRLLVKSAQDDTGAWTFGARFTELDGSALGGVRYDAQPHEPVEVAAHEAPNNASPLAEVLEEVEPALRRALLVHHDGARNGYEGDALGQARSLLELAPEHPVVLYQTAITHWTNDELGQTQDLLNEGVSRYPELAGFYWQRGAFYRERDRYDRALEDLTQAGQLEPNARLAAMELAGTFEDRGWREHQCRALADVVERWPDSGWALRAHGYCLQQRGYLPQAEERYRQADAVEPGHAWNLQRLAALARWRQDDDAAIRFVERLRPLAPWSTSHLLTIADQLRFASRRDASRAVLNEAVSRDPVWARPHQRLGTMAYEEGDEAAALEHWGFALERDPDNGQLADRIDALRDDEDDPDRQLMPSDAQIEAALVAATEMEIDPGAHTVLVLDDEVTTVQQDGSATRRITQVSLAITTDGRDELIQNRVPRSARILQAFSVGAGGARQEASSIRNGVVRFRGLETGSRVVLQYVYHSPPPAFLPNHFVSSWIFQGVHRQLGEARWVVQVPAGRELAMHVQGPVQHEVSRQGEHDVHVFTGAGVPPLVPEPAMPPLRNTIASVTLSTLTDWGEYVEWERALLSEVFESNPQLRALASRLTEGASTPRERFDRLYRYVSQEIRYQQDYEDTIAGVRPHSCPVVLERGYGDCKDKAVLMILLGREVGLDIRFTVLRTRGAGEVQRDVPNQQFNHAIIYVPQQEGIEEGFFMDPTTDALDMGNLRPDDQGATALVMNPDDGEWAFHEIPFQGPELSYFRCDVGVDVTGAEAATAQADCRIRGQIASTFRRVMRNEERAGQLRQNVAHSIFPGSAVTEASTEHVESIDHPLEMRLTLDASPALQPQGEERRLRVPSPFNLGRVTRLESRRLPLRLGVPDSARWEIRFSAPAGGRIVRTPDDFTVEHPCFRVSRQSRTRGRTATVTIDYTRTCTDVSPEDYPELRRQAQRAQNQLQAEVVIRP